MVDPQILYKDPLERARSQLLVDSIDQIKKYSVLLNKRKWVPTRDIDTGISHGGETGEGKK